MNPDDEICLCFHVTKRKVVQFIRTQRPQVPSQLSQCAGAGTGCGWCRPYLHRLFNEGAPEMAANRDEETPGAATEEPRADQYSQMRRQYLQSREDLGQ